jgi:hypothetical protein
VLVIHDCLFRARSLASVNPTVRRVRGFVELVSDSLTVSSVFFFFVARVVAVWSFRLTKGFLMKSLNMGRFLEESRANVNAVLYDLHATARAGGESRGALLR